MALRRLLLPLYRFVIAILLFLFLAACASGRMIEQQITPELFGAVGDGISDDTEALKKAFATQKTVVLNNKYRITRSLSLESSLKGQGTIIFDKDKINISISGKDLTIKGVKFDYRCHYGRMLKLSRASNVTINDCVFANVGTTQQTFANAMLVITGECNNVGIFNCRFLHCKSSPESSAQGIWIQQKAPKTINHHIYVKSCYFEDFQTIKDADAIKVLGGNYDCYLYVENCEFHKCAKRAMKFQGRECHSSNNKIFVTEPMHCAIAFQRGYGSSFNDTIIIDYNGTSEINKNAGLLYRAITISQGWVSVDGFKMVDKRVVINTHQAAIGIVSYGEEDTVISNVLIRNSYFSNGGVFLKVTDNISEIKGLTIHSTDFVDKVAKPFLSLSGAILKDAEIAINVKTN